MKLAALMFIFSVALCAAQIRNVSQKSDWDERNNGEPQIKSQFQHTIKLFCKLCKEFGIDVSHRLCNVNS